MINRNIFTLLLLCSEIVENPQEGCSNPGLGIIVRIPAHPTDYRC